VGSAKEDIVRVRLVVLASVVAFALPVFGAACGDDDAEAPTPTPPADTPTALAATPAPGVTPPAAAAPVLPADATFVTEGTEETTLVAGASLDLDPVHLAVRDVGSAPPCAGLVGQWTWAAISASAGGDPAALRVVGNRQGGEFEVGAGAEGSAEGGCYLAQFRNESAGSIQIQVRYIIGAIE
jgi:hypothetical protein